MSFCSRCRAQLTTSEAMHLHNKRVADTGEREYHMIPIAQRAIEAGLLRAREYDGQAFAPVFARAGR